jgi:hypothetical protein
MERINGLTKKLCFLIAVSFFTINIPFNLYGQNKLLFTYLDENKTVFDQRSEDQIRKIKSNNVFKSVGMINIGNVKVLESRNKLPVNLPNSNKVILATRIKLEVLNEL